MFRREGGRFGWIAVLLGAAWLAVGSSGLSAATPSDACSMTISVAVGAPINPNPIAGQLACSGTCTLKSGVVQICEPLVYQDVPGVSKIHCACRDGGRPSVCHGYLQRKEHLHGPPAWHLICQGRCGDGEKCCVSETVAAGVRTLTCRCVSGAAKKNCVRDTE